MAGRLTSKSRSDFNEKLGISSGYILPYPSSIPGLSALHFFSLRYQTAVALLRGNARALLYRGSLLKVIFQVKTLRGLDVYASSSSRRPVLINLVRLL